MGRRGLYVFGAHSRARTTARYLVELNQDNNLLGYLIDDNEKNPSEVGGVPVIDLRRCPELDLAASVYIGTRGVNFAHATETLLSLGFSDIHPVDIKLDTQLRTEYFRKRFQKEGKPFIKLDDLEIGSLQDTNQVNQNSDACIFEVKSAYDKPLQKNKYQKDFYEKSIQVGAALTDIRLDDCTYRDDDGDNISDSNRQLCEITALYWIWKHSNFEIVGLVHYRRHFLLPDRWLERIITNDVDIIVPIPLYIEPSVEENYRERHVSSDWDYMIDSMKENHPDQMDAVKVCFSDTYYHPCNMFIMKKPVFEEYCNWLFPILFYVTDKVGKREDVYQNRYPAFMAERLLTLFCHINRDKYKIVFADKNFLD